MKMPELPEVELPKLPPMGYGNEGYSVFAMQQYAVEYAEKFALQYAESVREACARECDRIRSVSAVSYETGAACAAAIRRKEE